MMCLINTSVVHLKAHKTVKFAILYIIFVLLSFHVIGTQVAFLCEQGDLILKRKHKKNSREKSRFAERKF